MDEGFPVDEKITIAWLVRYVPIAYWLALLGLASACAGAGYSFAVAAKPQCSLTEISALRDRKDALTAELADMVGRKATLTAQISALEAQREVEAMSDTQVSAELKKFTRK